MNSEVSLQAGGFEFQTSGILATTGFNLVLSSLISVPNERHQIGGHEIPSCGCLPRPSDGPSRSRHPQKSPRGGQIPSLKERLEETFGLSDYDRAGCILHAPDLGDEKPSAFWIACSHTLGKTNRAFYSVEPF
ncbi:Uncharacterized protein FKW44_017349 [Caligus rogercresseyi]|uniref:Uncharacterized protein n=1 Tax=Caligus rogercresseyi TaxID=217165 RepID=A0A7T8GST8_CALRO|nr:Uncharacterized protein FKW44_017349 [Caligus rogercresseyi]